MKKKFLQFVVLISLVMLLYSCKKGDEDPFISFRSRDNRIIGTWELYKMDANSYSKSVYYFDNHSNINEETCTYSFKNNAIVSSCIDEDGETETSTTSYSQSITINKDGTFVEKVSDDDGSYEYNGLWSWINNVKDKVAIKLFSYSVGWYKFDGDVDYSIFFIDKLSEKELILTQDVSRHSVSNDGKSEHIYTYSAVYIFHKKKE